MRCDAWTPQEDLRYDHTLLGDLTSLRFLDAGQSAIILGGVGVGKTNLAIALGHKVDRDRDFYEIVVERHRAKTTIVTYNLEPAEWLTMTADTLLAQSAIDRLTATAHTLVIEGPSCRQRTRGQLDPDHPDERPR